MTKLPTAEFMRTFGKYVYCFTKTDSYKDAYYGGKSGFTATGTRCLDHIKDKGYDYDDIMIIARNLETFDNRPEELLESWLIMTEDFDDNKKSGSHKECFIMGKLSFLFSQHEALQRNMLTEGPRYVLDNEDALSNRNSVTGTKSSYKIGSSAIKSCYINIELNSTKEFPVVHFSNNKDVKEFQKIAQPAFAEEYPDLEVRKNTYGFEVDTESFEQALEMWDEFHRS